MGLSLLTSPAATTDTGISAVTRWVELETPLKNLSPPGVRFSMMLISMR